MSKGPRTKRKRRALERTAAIIARRIEPTKTERKKMIADGRLPKPLPRVTSRAPRSDGDFVRGSVATPALP